MQFFPNLPFGWTFFGVLIALLVVAAFIDARRLLIPKWISLSVLALGLLFNLARGAWLGGLDLPVWTLAPGGVGTGAADGFLFALAGFCAGFGIFFVLWVLGICRGGDLKLFAAVSTWVGPEYALWIMALSTVIMFVTLVLKLGTAFLSSRPQAAPAPRTDKKTKGVIARNPRQARGVTYAWPLALATALVLLWFFRVDLHLPLPQPAAGAPVNTFGMECLLLVRGAHGSPIV